METYLVTGGAGFIGSNFIHYMSEKNSKIRLINVDKLTYAGNLMNLENISTKIEDYLFIKEDICNRTKMMEIFSTYKPEYVINFAAESHVDRSIAHSEDFILTNILGTEVLLQCAKNTNVKRFIQVSTDEVYGSLKEDYFYETSPIAPNNPYSASKASAELIVRAFQVTHGLPVIITRSGNNYGPRQHREKLIPMVIQKSLARENIPIYGDGKNIRDWIYVYDHCNAIYQLIHKGTLGEIYNIGANNEKTNIEIVIAIIEKLKYILTTMNLDVDGISTDLIQFTTDRKGHDRRYAIDTKKLRKELAWEPSYTFDKGLEDTIKWYIKQNLFGRKLYEGSNLSRW